MGIKHNRLWLGAAFVWGFAEATAFFVVPDVMLTLAVFVLSGRMAFRLAGAAAVAAALGGWLMMAWGASSLDEAREFLLSVPLIGEDLLIRVQEEVSNDWPLNLILGAVTGAPYKIYAVEAGAAQVNPILLAAVSIPARFARFAVTIGFALAGKRFLELIGKSNWGPWACCGVWAVVYSLYIYIRLAVGT